MPCTYTGSLEGDHIMFLEEDAKKAQKALTETTQAACEMSKWLTPEQKLKLSAKTQAWIAKHDKVDSKAGRKK